jgi:hypothetical protein
MVGGGLGYCQSVKDIYNLQAPSVEDNQSLEEFAMFRRHGTWMAASFILFVLATSGLTQNPNKDDKNPETSGAKSGLPLEQMVKSITEQPLLSNQSFYYDSGFKAIGSYSIHDHFAKRMCMGYLVSDGKKLAYRYIRAMPGLGSSNDAFETEFKNIERVEYKFYAASTGMMDYYPERLSVKFYFKTPITGLLANWEKKDMKFDIWDVNFAKKMMEFIKAADIPAVEKG